MGPKIICLTPVRNEAWILRRFLDCASLWADHIIVADQSSADSSREIAASYPKVTLVSNPEYTYHEKTRQTLLIESARKIPGRNLLIGLDADEVLSANCFDSPEWKTVLKAPEGSVIYFQWVNILPNLRSYWTPHNDVPFGFMDDGSVHTGAAIHSPRVPIPVNAPKIHLRDIKVLHYQYTDWDRMRSKHRFYQCWERIHHPNRSSVEIYREYHHMDSVPSKEIRNLEHEWMSGYLERGIDMTSIYRDRSFWFDREVLTWFSQFGLKKFRREAIWDVDWATISKDLHGLQGISHFPDPRDRFERFVHCWLQKSQKYSSSLPVRFVDSLLRLMGW